MNKVKNYFTFKRAFCLLFALIIFAGAFTAVFLENGITAKAALSVGDYSMVFFNVPETIYLTPGATSFEYVCDQTMDDNGGISITTESKLISAGANVSFYCPTAVSISISAPSSITLGKTSVSSGNRLDTTFTSGSVSENKSQVLTWTATYTDSADGRTKTAYAYTYVYSPFTGTVAGESFSRRKASNDDACIANSTVWITGIHRITGLTHGQSSYDDFGGVINNNPLFGGSAATTSTPRNDTIDSGNAYGKGVMTRGSATGEGWSAHWSANGSSSPYEDRHTALYEAWITVDRSRFTNFNNIPNLECGLDIHEIWTPNGKTNRSLGISTDGSNTTNLIARASSDQASDYFKGKRERSLVNFFTPDTNGAVIIAGNAMARISNSYPSAYLNYQITNKASLRSTLNYAQGAGFAYTADYKNALLNAYTVLGKPDADAASVNSANATLQSEVDKFESGDSAVYFNVPEVIYLTPGAATYQYVCDQTMDASGNITVNQGYKAISSGGNINFYCPGASSATVSSSYGTAPSDTNSAADRYDATITSGTWSSSTTSGYITWTATYIKNGETYTKTAYTHVYAPYLNAVAAISNGNSRETGYSETATWTALWGIHDVLTSYSDSLNLDGDYNHGSDIDATIVYKYKLNEHSTTPSNYYGGSAPSALYSSVDGTKSSTSKSGGAYFYKNSSNAASSDVAGGTGVIYIDPTRVKKIGDIPNFYVHSYLGSFKTDGSESYTIDCSNWAKYYVIGSDGAIKNSSKYDTGSVKNFSSLTKVADPSLSSLAISSGYKFYNVSFRTWRKRNGVGTKDDMRRADAVVGCVFEGNNKSKLRDLVEESISVNTDAFDSASAATFNSAYEAAYKALTKVDIDSDAVEEAYQNLSDAKAGKTRSNAHGQYYNTINNAHDTSILPDVSRAFTLGDKITATAEDISGYVYKKMEFPFDVGSFYLRSQERTGTNIASVSVNSANNSITVTSGGSGTDNFTSMPSTGADSRNLYYLEVEPGAKVTLSANINGSSSQMYIFGLDANGKWTNSVMASTYAAGQQSITLDIPAGVKYVCFRFGNTSANTTTTFSNITLAYTGDSIYLTRVQKLDITFKFWYEPKPYTINLDGNGATSTNHTTSVDCKMGATLPSITLPSRTGYTFLGYYDANSGGTQYYTATGVGSVWNKSNNATLYAHWKANTYTVTFDAQGATSTNHTANATATYDAELPTIIKPTKTGYDFAGYFTAVNGGGTKYYNADGTAAQTSWKNTSGLTLYANWTVKQWYLDVNGKLDSTYSGNISGFGTVDVYVNGVLTSDDCSDYYTQHPYGAKYEITDIKPAIGHTYDGYIDADGVTHSAEDSIVGYIPADRNISVTLIFHTNHYFIEYQANGGAHVTGTMQKSEHVYGVEKHLNPNAFVNTFELTYNYNYAAGDTPHKNGPESSQTVQTTFQGWAKTPTGNKAYNNWQSVLNLTEEDQSTITLYAKWKSPAVELPKPARLGYTFGGWYLDEALSKPAGPSYTPQSDVKFYAKWNPLEYANVVLAYDYITEITTQVIADNSSFPAGGTLTLGTGLQDKPLNSATERSNLSGQTTYISKDGYIAQLDSQSKFAEIKFHFNEYSATQAKDVEFYYEYRFTENRLTQYITGKINFVPANNVYYEEYKFNIRNSVNPETSDEFHTPQDWNTRWYSRKSENEDSDSYPVYGYNRFSNTDVYNGFSNGRVLRTTVSNENPVSKTAEFEFTGEGFDLYSVCGPNTSVLMVYVWNVTEENGVKEYSPVANAAVDTYLSDAELLTADERSESLLRQVPVYHFDSLADGGDESQTYLVQVYALWMDDIEVNSVSPADVSSSVIEQLETNGIEVNEDIFELEWIDDNSVFNGGEGAASSDDFNVLSTQAAGDTLYGYIDGIRVYNPGDYDPAVYPDGYNAEYIASEQNAAFYNLKQFTRNTSVNEYRDYISASGTYGNDPLNEVYLAPYVNETTFGATAFKISGFDSDTNHVMISARAVSGTPILMVRGSDPDQEELLIQLLSGSEMYYDISDYIFADADGNAMVYIQQYECEEGEAGYIALGGVKLTSGNSIDLPIIINPFDIVSLTPAEANAAMSYMQNTKATNPVEYNLTGSSVKTETGTPQIISDPEQDNPGQDDPGTDDPVTPPTPAEAKLSILAYPETLKVDYRATVVFHTKAEAMPEGAAVKWYINGTEKASGGDFTLSDVKADSTVQAKLVGSDGTVLAQSQTVKVQPKTGFFAKLIAFFRSLFGKLPVIDKR